MSRYLWLWAAWLLIGLAFEVWAVWFHPDPWDTLSEFTLYALKVNTKAGFACLVTLMLFLFAWFPGHVRALSKRHSRTLVVKRDDKA